MNMTKRLTALLLLLCMAFTLLAACGDDGVVSPEEAEKIVLKDLGVTAGQVTMHTHTGTYDGAPCYSVYVTLGDQTLEYVIHGISGEILSVGEGTHSH